MNFFRLIADSLHLLSILILLQKIHSSRSCSGISWKSQLLYSIVFITRYLDLFFTFISLYNTLMKIFFISSSLYILYLMKKRFKGTYDLSVDNFKSEYLIVSSLILGLIFNVKFTFVEILWSFSIFLESVAILPQLFLLSKTGEAETITTHYIFCLGMYRAFYILNWIYRYYTEHYVDWIAWICGAVQTVLYLDFFYIYVTKVLQGKKFELPA
jgi:ER lumen protein retaining receptor